MKWSTALGPSQAGHELETLVMKAVFHCLHQLCCTEIIQYQRSYDACLTLICVNYMDTETRGRREVQGKENQTDKIKRTRKVFLSLVKQVAAAGL